MNVDMQQHVHGHDQQKRVAGVWRGGGGKGRWVVRYQKPCSKHGRHTKKVDCQAGHMGEVGGCRSKTCNRLTIHEHGQHKGGEEKLKPGGGGGVGVDRTHGREWPRLLD